MIFKARFLSPQSLYFLNLILEATTDRNVTSSICPAGWVLPLSGNASGSNNSVSGSFNNLITKESATASIIVQPPLSFVRSGAIYLDNGNVNYVGSRGYYRSRTASSPTTAYNLSFLSSGVTPSGYSSHFVGYPLRWLIPSSFTLTLPTAPQSTDKHITFPKYMLQ